MVADIAGRGAKGRRNTATPPPFAGHARKHKRAIESKRNRRKANETNRNN